MQRNRLRGHRNLLLDRMPEQSFLQLAPHLAPVDLPAGITLEQPDQLIEQVYFLEDGVGSVIAQGGEGQQMEVGLFGAEGMSGTMVVMGGDRSPHLTVMQIPGRGMRIEAQKLREAMENVELRNFLLGFVQVLAIQTAHTVLANGKLKIEERLARWLLMCRDRMDGDTLALTHDFLSVMLGVRRAGVTVATHMLEGQGLIRAKRGMITIMDREGLEEVTHGLYGRPEAEYERLVAV